MKKIVNSIFYIACAVLPCTAQITVNTELETTLAKKFVLSSQFRVFYNYYPDIKYFLTTGYRNLENGPAGLLSYIHEGSHVYNNIKSAGMGNSLYYWYDSTTLLKAKLLQGYVTTDSIFNTLPIYIKDKSITKTYVGCTNNCFSRTYGIYGLLEEFNAYSLEPRSLLDMYNFFDTCTYTSNQKFWQGYLKCKYDSWMNFYYFNIFFSTYMKYIEVNRKDFYNEIVSDTSFRKVFTTIHNKYSNALERMNCIENAVLKKIKKVNAKKYEYPFIKEYNTVKALSDSEDTQKYLLLLLNK